MEKWKCRSRKVSQENSVLVKGWKKASSCCICCPLTSVPWVAAWSCLDHHFPGDIHRALGVGKIPVGRKRKLGSETRQGRPESSLNLVRGTGEKQEN